MIFTKIGIKNWYSFGDCELDLTYPRKIVDTTIPYEYLEEFENIRFKRVVILSGANASGKTSFAKIICAIRNFLKDKTISTFIIEGVHSSLENLGFEVEFLDSFPTTDKVKCDDTVESKIYDHIHSLKVEFLNSSESSNNPRWIFKYKCIKINKSDSMQSLRTRLDLLNSNESISKNMIFISNYDIEVNSEKYVKSIFEFNRLNFTTGWNFLYNDLSKDSDTQITDKLNKEVLEAVLKTFDPSIKNIKYAVEEGGEGKPKGFFVNFSSGKELYISKDGQVAEKRFLLSLGTYESIKIANFISIVFSTKLSRGCTFFLDESMAHVQSEIERNIVNLIIQKMNNYSQFFYTTHNYDILDMNLPIHSFLFIRKDEENKSYFVKAEDSFKKNDRSIINYIKNDVLGTIPNTQLLDEILLKD